ncbi:beta-lactamase family protein [Photobacterium sagamiensis]|uniref:serine hydrolase domain-containing protein n=1 Tax=Photobacterium sagamiensis TaxID=2910241 RepID=UPI003D0DB259
MKSISRRDLLKVTSVLGCTGVGLHFGYNALKDPLVKLDEALSRAVNDLPAASISAAIIKNNKLYWSKNYGYQDIPSRTLMTTDSAWQTIGSISKLVVWTAIMRLVDQGVLDLQTDISDYLGFNLRSPHYPDSKITIHNLLTHSSSLSSRKLMSAPYPMADSFCRDNYETLEAWVLKTLPPSGSHYSAEAAFDNYKPGDYSKISNDPLGVIAGYSNLNAVVAAYIVERATGLDFKTYCDNEIFSPCGMVQTSWSKEKLPQLITHYEAESSPRSPIMAVYTKAMLDQGYASKEAVLNKEGKKYIDFTDCDYFSSVYPMGLLGTSLQSFLPFLLAHLNEGKVNGYQLLKPETVKEIFSYQRKDTQIGSELGLGWFRNADSKGNVSWGHDGGGPGILSSAHINPEQGTGVVLFINNFHVNYTLRAKLLKTMNEIAIS